jgi:hypothetical protein
MYSKNKKLYFVEEYIGEYVLNGKRSPKYPTATFTMDTEHWLPYLKITFQGFIRLRMCNYGHRD